MKTKMKGYGDLGNGDSMRAVGTKKSEVHGSGASTTLFSTLRIKTCVTQRLPFSQKTHTSCSSGGGPHESPLGNKGDWRIRVQLQQPVVGELLGTGSITTNVRSAKYKRTTDVIAAGKVREDGTAKVKLTPLYDDGDGPVTLTVRVVAGPGVQWPAVTQVLEAKGKLLGQKFNEVLY
jgi:hypothetical protein